MAGNHKNPLKKKTRHCFERRTIRDDGRESPEVKKEEKRERFSFLFSRLGKLIPTKNKKTKET